MLSRVLAFSFILPLGFFSIDIQAESPKLRIISETQLKQILNAHKEWIKSSGKKGGKADLSLANLPRVNLHDADLRSANLEGAILHEADLRYIKLQGAILQGAELQDAKLQGAILQWTNFQSAKLHGANLFQADLKDADFWGADLAEVIYEPKPGSLPRIQHAANAENLSKMTFQNKELGLVELREAFKKAGLRSEERQLTYAINHTRRSKAWKEGAFLSKVESVLKLVLFEWTSDYGMTPSRPLLVLVILILIFSLPYMFALKLRGRSGIWAVRPHDWLHSYKARSKRVRVTSFRQTRSRKTTKLKLKWNLQLALLRRLLRVIRIGLYFSLLSSFHIGWRDLNVGHWISRLQFREYNLRPMGWVRFASGLQSLVSVYLMALSVLTYFGRPFE